MVECGLCRSLSLLLLLLWTLLLLLLLLLWMLLLLSVPCTMDSMNSWNIGVSMNWPLREREEEDEEEEEEPANSQLGGMRLGFPLMPLDDAPIPFSRLGFLMAPKKGVLIILDLNQIRSECDVTDV